MVEDLPGETVFLVLPKNIYYLYHYSVSDALISFDPTCEYGWYFAIGYLFSKKILEKQMAEK